MAFPKPGLPKRFYFVKVVNSNGKLRVYEKGGGKYSHKGHAKNQFDRLIAQGVEAEMYESQPLEWTRIDGPTSV